MQSFPSVRSIVIGADDDPPLPHNDDAAETHREFCAHVLLHEGLAPVDAVFTSEGYGHGFAVTLARCFRQNGFADATVTHAEVDRAREIVPVSGTQLRADVHAKRQFLHPEVYASFIERVGLLGGESSGKTSLAGALARQFETVWAPECGRELWERRQGDLC